MASDPSPEPIYAAPPVWTGPAEQLFSRLKALLSAKTVEALFAPRLDA